MSEPKKDGMAELWKILGRRWTLAILQNLSAAEARRFSEIKKSLQSISGTMLSERLAELEREGLVTKKVYSAVPPKVKYRLTASARELFHILRDVCAWRIRWARGNDLYELVNLSAR